MPSFNQILFLAAIILVLFYGSKIVARINRRGETGDKPAKPRATRQKREQVQAEELVPCPRCGAYVSADGQHDCRKSG